MNKLVLLLVLFTVNVAFSNEVPKKALGQYEATVPSFEFVDNGHKLTASAYDVQITLKPNYMWYQCGSILLRGDYFQVNQDGDLVEIKTKVSNDVSIEFDMGLEVNQKTGSIVIKDLIGVPETKLVKRQIVLTKKPGRFKRL